LLTDVMGTFPYTQMANISICSSTETLMCSTSAFESSASVQLTAALNAV
jgi:hypothetical protein